MTQEESFENFLFCPNSTFNIGKSHKISSGKALYFISYQPKTSRGGGGGGGDGKHPPSAFRVKEIKLIFGWNDSAHVVGMILRMSLYWSDVLSLALQES